MTELGIKYESAPEKVTLSKLDYRDYPEFMFAIVAAYLPSSEGDDLRRVAGDVVFRHEGKYGRTYKNGVLHSYNDEPAYYCFFYQLWYRDGKRHRDGDLPAIINGNNKEWYRDGKRHRDGDLPAFISDDNKQIWYKNGIRHRDGDKPAYIYGKYKQWWVSGKQIKIEN